MYMQYYTVHVHVLYYTCSTILYMYMYYSITIHVIAKLVLWLFCERSLPLYQNFHRSMGMMHLKVDKLSQQISHPVKWYIYVLYICNMYGQICTILSKALQHTKCTTQKQSHTNTYCTHMSKPHICTWRSDCCKVDYDVLRHRAGKGRLIYNLYICMSSLVQYSLCYVCSLALQCFSVRSSLVA